MFNKKNKKIKELEKQLECERKCRKKLEDIIKSCPKCETEKIYKELLACKDTCYQ